MICDAPMDEMLGTFFCTSMSLKQQCYEWITEKSKTLIDLLFVKDLDRVKTFGLCDASGVSDHFFIYMAYNIKKPKFKPITVTRRDFRKFDLPGFQRAAEVANWENVFAVQDVNDKVYHHTHICGLP